MFVKRRKTDVFFWFYRHGDWVEFRIATDRRDQLKRATCISLLEDSFIVSGERREQGVIDSIDDDGTGYVQLAERDVKIPFKLTEMLDVEKDFAVGDEVEFTIIMVIFVNIFCGW